MKEILFDLEADGLLDEVTRVVMGVTYAEEDGWMYWGDQVSVVDLPDAPAYGGGVDSLLDYLGGADLLLAHNAICYDLPVLLKLHDFIPSGEVRDTLVLSRMCHPILKVEDVEAGNGLKGSHSLVAWGQRLGRPKLEYNGPWDVASEKMLEYCHRDVEVLCDLYETLRDHPSNTPAFRECEHRIAEIIFEQERNGFCFDVDRAQEFERELLTLRAEITDELNQVFPPRVIEMKTPEYYECSGVETLWGDKDYTFPTKGKAREFLRKQGYTSKESGQIIQDGPLKTKEIPFNPGSSDQIVDRLKEKYGWKPTAFTEPSKTFPQGKPKADEAVLKELPYPECETLIKYMLVDKRLGQLASGNNAWLKLEKSGRIHGRVNPLGTRTTRMSHFDPNMAQVPASHHYLGRECRELFQPRDGWVLVGCDASGLEARMLAHYMAFFDGGEFARLVLDGDIHEHNAETWDLEREDAKAPFYQLIYGGGNASLQKKTGKAGVKTKFIREWPKYGLLEASVKDRAEKNGWVKGLDGRRIMCPESYRALNTLLQGGGAVVMKYAKVFFWKAAQSLYGPHGERWALCADIHDESQQECEPEIAEGIGQLYVDSIRKAGEHLNLKCPLDGKYKVGESWASTH